MQRQEARKRYRILECVSVPSDGKTRRERIKNMVIRNMFQQESVAVTVERKELHWFGRDENGGKESKAHHEIVPRRWERKRNTKIDQEESIGSS